MASLSDQIDRLSRNTRAIKGTAALTAAIDSAHSGPSAVVAGPFTRAVLTTHLGDLIRDIDPSELGLFTLQAPAQDARAPSASHISRAEFTGATPLRKPPPRRDDAPKPNDVEPETYANAALRCIDRYQSIRPMPRAHTQVEAILERLVRVRENIQGLKDALQQAQSDQAPDLKTLIDNEEKRVQNLQSRVVELNKRKQDAASQKKPPKAGKSVQARSKPQPTAILPSSPQESKFWNTPAAAARTLRFTDNLMDEQVDLGDITTTSFMMGPLPPSPSMGSRSESFRHFIDASQDEITMNAPSRQSLSPQDHDGPYTDEQEEQEDFDEEGEKTVVLKKPAPTPVIADPGSPVISHPDEDSIPEVPASSLPETPGLKQPKVKVTSEVEQFVARIWATIGDMIMPGHPFDITGRAGGNKPPRAKETIAHLQSLSALSPSPTSPSASSISSSAGIPTPPTSQQILTAHMLLSLLTSPPHFSIPLNTAKDLLVAKASSGGSATGAGQGTTRIIYGCVAKRLVKIDRGGGEQIVKFDI